MIVTAYQRPLGNLAEERLVKFGGRERYSITLSVIEDDRGYRLEGRVGRRLVSRIMVGAKDDARLRAALAQAVSETQDRLLEML